MAPGNLARKIKAYGGDDEPAGNHVILRIPNPIRTAAQKRQCAVTGLQFGRVIRRAKNPLPVKVYREAGYWVHELEEFRVLSAEKEFEKSREYFRDHLLYLYQRFLRLKPDKATSDAIEMRDRFLKAFSEEEIVA